MFKKFLVVTLGLVMFMSCQQNSSTDSKNGKTAVKKEVKKNIEVKFSFEDFTGTFLQLHHDSFCFSPLPSFFSIYYPTLKESL